MQISKIETAKNCLKDCKNALHLYLDDILTATIPPDDEALKLRAEYFNWVNMKTKLINCEKNFVLPCNALPNKISEYIYNYLYSDKKEVVDRHYKKDINSGEFIINVNKKSIPTDDVELLIHNLVLRRGNVIWVNFGFNIGREFRGKHPALILKNTKDTLIVLPLSSQFPNTPDVNVKIDNVSGLPLRTRWGNVLRIVPISILRIDFNSPVGDVKGNVLSEISNKVKLHGIK